MISVLHSASSSSSSLPPSPPSPSACSPSASASSPTFSPPFAELGPDATLRLVSAYRAYERALLGVFAAGSRLGEVATEAQQEHGLPPTYGRQLFAAIAKSNLSITDALGTTAQGHRLLEAIGRSLGIDVTAYGDKQEPPKVFVGA